MQNSRVGTSNLNCNSFKRNLNNVSLSENHSKSPHLKPPKIKGTPLLKIIFTRCTYFLPSFSTANVGLIR